MPEEAELGWLGTAAAQRAHLLLWERQDNDLLRIVATASVDAFEGQYFFLPRSLYAAWAHQLRRDRPAARAAFDSALFVIDTALQAAPDDYRLHAARGLALAGLGRRDEALQEARWIEHSEVYRNDTVWGPIVAEDRARILSHVGEVDAALDEIERLMAGPSISLSVHTLRLDPRWDPIREHPRFQALLAQHPNP